MSLDHPANIVKHQTLTRDAFLGGRLEIVQPRRGFRAGLESVLLGAAVGTESGRLADLGAGVGTAGLVALAHRPGLTATLVETDPDMLELARQNIEGNDFTGRVTAIALDVTAPGAHRHAAGLPAAGFETVLANPPFFAAGAGTLAKGPSRARARHMPAGTLDAWVRTAAACAKPGGEAIFVLPAECLLELLAAFDGRFGALTLLPLSPRPDRPASRILVRGIKGSRAPLTLLPARPLHAADGEGFTPEFESILRGATQLLW